jgi:hypothetical protein
MRRVVICLAGIAVVSACSKAPATTALANAAAPAGAATKVAPAGSGPSLTGTYSVDGKPAALTQVTAHKGDPRDGQPVTDIVFSEKDQGGDAQAAEDALEGNFGDAIVAKVASDGSLIGVDIRHTALHSPISVSISGILTMSDYRLAGGEVSGRLTSGGPVDVFDQKLGVDLAFHTKAP